MTGKYLVLDSKNLFPLTIFRSGNGRNNGNEKLWTGKAVSLAKSEDWCPARPEQIYAVPIFLGRPAPRPQ